GARHQPGSRSDCAGDRARSSHAGGDRRLRRSPMDDGPAGGPARQGNPDLELALELADLAAEIALPRFRDRDFTVTIKSDGSPVTDVDQAVERALRARLAELRPDHAVLGEEYGASGDGEWCWYLDPIDGTARFVEGDPNWMTFVALGRGADIAVGVVAVPAQSERWWAAKGAGAFLDGERLAVSTVAQLSDATVNDDWRGTLENR